MIIVPIKALVRTSLMAGALGLAALGAAGAANAVPEAPTGYTVYTCYDYATQIFYDCV